MADTSHVPMINAATANATSAILATEGVGWVRLDVDVTGAFDGTINFQSRQFRTFDDQNSGLSNLAWKSHAVFLCSDWTTATATHTGTVDTAYSMPVRGADQVRATITGMSAGTVTLHGRGTGAGF